MPTNMIQASAFSTGNHAPFQAARVSAGRKRATNSRLRQVYRIFLKIQVEKHTPWSSAAAAQTQNRFHSRAVETRLLSNRRLIVR